MAAAWREMRKRNELVSAACRHAGEFIERNPSVRHSARTVRKDRRFAVSISKVDEDGFDVELVAGSSSITIRAAGYSEVLHARNYFDIDAMAAEALASFERLLGPGVRIIETRAGDQGTAFSWKLEVHIDGEWHERAVTTNLLHNPFPPRRSRVLQNRFLGAIP